MKLFLIGFIFFSIVSNPKGCREQNNDLVYWHQRRNLTWNDFKGLAKKNDTLSVGCSVKILLDYEITQRANKFRVYCVFSKSESWYKHSSDYALKHEMGHFDLGEIIARMLRKRLGELEDQNYVLDKKEMDSVFNLFTNKLFERQAAYDKETNHSLNILEQSNWDKKNHNELDSLKLYENANRRIKIKQ